MLDTIGAGVYAIICVIALAIASLCWFLFVSKEENFEDVIAAQKKKQEALLNSLQGSAAKNTKSNNKKWTKLKEKKEKNRKDPEAEQSDSGVDYDEPNVESVTAPPTKQDGRISTKKQNKKSKKEAAIPHPTTENKGATTETLTVDKPKKENKNKIKPVQEELVLLKESMLVEEEPMIVDTEEFLVESAPPVPDFLDFSESKEEGSQKKKAAKKLKNQKKEGKTLHVTIGQLLREIENAQLSSGELQEIIDSLLVKQNDGEQWKKTNQKNDPMEMLRKQILELDSQLVDERKNSQGTVHKNKELRSQLQQERNQKQSMQSQIESRVSQQTKEHERLLKRMEDQHLSEMQSTQTQIQRMQQLIDGGNSHMELQHLKEENTHLKNASLRATQLAEDKKALMNELNQLQQRNNQFRQDLENAKLQSKQIELQIQNSQRAKAEAEAALSMRLQEVNNQLLKTEGQNRGLVQQLQQVQNDSQQAKQELQNVQLSQNSMVDNRLPEASAEMAETLSKLKYMEEGLESTKSDLIKKTNELLATQAEQNKSLSVINEHEKTNEHLQKENAELKATMEKTSTNDVDQSSVNQIGLLETLLEEKNGKETELQETIDNLKKKNNELREKNWKAVDALNKAEKDTTSIGNGFKKGLKSIFPTVTLPPMDLDNVDTFFQVYNVEVQVFLKEQSEKYNNSVLNCEKLSKELEEIKEAQKDSNNTEDSQKIQKENSHLKNVLADTESMLSRLQTGVDTEVSKWQKKVEDTDLELDDCNKKITALEAQLSDQGVEKKEISQMETQLKETKKEKTNLEEKLTQLEEKQSSSSSEVNDLNTKLKKTISERDLLIREYKALKENSSKHGVENSKATEEQERTKKELTDGHAKELKRKSDQIIALENAAKTSGKGDKDKDKLIAKLYFEIEELKDDLREERDRVIVDIETPDAQLLHEQVDALTEEKHTLSVKLTDLEKSFSEEQSDKDKVLDLESRLKASEAKIKDLETEKNKQIQNQIADAMQQAAIANAGTTV